MAEMINLDAFLNPVELENERIAISDRFKDKEGKPIKWEIRPLSQEENMTLIKRFTKRKKNGAEHFDQVGYGQALVCTAVVYPDLDNSKLQKAYGVLGKEQLINKTLTIGEFANLSLAVRNLSGLDDDINDVIEEVKN